MREIKGGGSTAANKQEDSSSAAAVAASSPLETLFVPPNEPTTNMLREPLLLNEPSLDSIPDPSSVRSGSFTHNDPNNNNNPTSRLWHSWRRFRLSDESRRHLRELIRRSGNYLAYFTLLTMLMVLPNVIYRGAKAGRIDLAAYRSAGVMVLGTIVLSFRLVYLHLTHWYMPEVHKIRTTYF